MQAMQVCRERITMQDWRQGLRWMAASQEQHVSIVKSRDATPRQRGQTDCVGLYESARLGFKHLSWLAKASSSRSIDPCWLGAMFVILLGAAGVLCG